MDVIELEGAGGVSESHGGIPQGETSEIPQQSAGNGLTSASHVDKQEGCERVTVTVEEVEIIQCPSAQKQSTCGLMSSATNSIQPCSQGATIQAVPSMSCSSSQDSSMMPAVSFSNSGILLPMGMLPSVSVVQNPAQMLPAASVQPAMQQPVQPAMQQAVQPVPQQPQACTAQYSSVGYQLAPIQTGTGQSFNSLMQLDTSGSFTESLMSERPGTRDDCPQVCRWAGCDSYFSDRESLILHVNTVHIRLDKDGADYKCHWMDCPRRGRGFNARYKMLIHIRTHTNEKPHICPACQKRFSRLENLKIHKRSHTGEKPYMCPIEGCHKAYSNSSDRFKHVRTHQEERPYVCKMPGCNKRYTDPSSLRKHVRIQGHSVSNPPINIPAVPVFQNNVSSEHITQNAVSGIDKSCTSDESSTGSSSTSGQKGSRLEELPLDLSRTVAGASVGSGDNYVLKITYVS